MGQAETRRNMIVERRSPRVRVVVGDDIHPVYPNAVESPSKTLNFGV